MKDKILWIVVAAVLIAIFVYSLFFSQPTYKVTFDSSGGTEIVSQEVKRNDLAIKPENPVRDGYDFVGWVVDGITFDFTQPVTKDVEIKAVWKEKIVYYTVTFNSKGGSKIDSAQVEKGKKVTKPTKPTRKGYTFVEWELNGKKYDFSNAVSKDITLTAKWKKSK